MQVKFKNSIYRHYENEIMAGWEKLANPEEVSRLTVSWKGKKISLQDVQKIVAFFEWAFKETNGETYIRGYYDLNPKTDLGWFFCPPHQIVSYGSLRVRNNIEKDKYFNMYCLPGQPTKETIDSFESQEAYGEFLAQNFERLPNWRVVFTAHTHAKAEAFMSGQDEDDEKKIAGLHMTLGNMDANKFSTHFRTSMLETIFEANLVDWFEIPEIAGIGNLQNIPEVVALLVKHVWSTPTRGTVLFPEEWKDFIEKDNYVYYSGNDIRARNFQEERAPYLHNPNQRIVTSSSTAISEIMRGPERNQKKKKEEENLENDIAFEQAIQKVELMSGEEMKELLRLEKPMFSIVQAAWAGAWAGLDAQETADLIEDALCSELEERERSLSLGEVKKDDGYEEYKRAGIWDY